MGDCIDGVTHARLPQDSTAHRLGIDLATSGMSACLYTVLVVIAPARS
jgi:hypothetical protein